MENILNQIETMQRKVEDIEWEMDAFLTAMCSDINVLKAELNQYKEVIKNV